jgi:hypothetical protein
MAKKGGLGSIPPLVWFGMAGFLGYMFLKADAAQKRADVSIEAFKQQKVESLNKLRKLYEERKAAGDNKTADEIMKKIMIVEAMKAGDR